MNATLNDSERSSLQPRQRLVLVMLRSAWLWTTGYDEEGGPTDPTMVDGWVNGHLLCAPHLGGSEGLRRIRELRSLGYPIEKRRKPVPGSAEYQYRIAFDRRLP